jgi:hypothetical protein
MSWKKAGFVSIGALGVLLVLFEVQMNFEFSLPGKSEQPDPDQEARFATCYADRDGKIHDVAFSTIDNPDVQKLYILNNRELAVTECRLLFPEKWIAIDESFRFNLLDLQFRF